MYPDPRLALLEEAAPLGLHNLDVKLVAGQAQFAGGDLDGLFLGTAFELVFHIDLL